MSLGEDLRSFLVGSTGIAAASTRWSIAGPGVVEQNTLRQEAPDPRIWFQRAGQETEHLLDTTEGLTSSTWDIEVHSSLDAERFTIADAIKARLDGYQGTLGSTSRSAASVVAFVEDHDDEYIPRGVASEESLYVAALRAIIMSTGE